MASRWTNTPPASYRHPLVFVLQENCIVLLETSLTTAIISKRTTCLRLFQTQASWASLLLSSFEQASSHDEHFQPKNQHSDLYNKKWYNFLKIYNKHSCNEIINTILRVKTRCGNFFRNKANVYRVTFKSWFLYKCTNPTKIPVIAKKIKDWYAILHACCNNCQTYHSKTEVDQMDAENPHWSDDMQTAFVSVTGKHCDSLQSPMKTSWLHHQYNLSLFHISAITVLISNTQRSTHH